MWGPEPIVCGLQRVGINKHVEVCHVLLKNEQSFTDELLLDFRGIFHGKSNYAM